LKSGDRAHKRSKSSAKALSVSQANTAFHSAANDCANNRYGKSDLTPFTVHVQDSSNVTEAFYKVVIKRQISKLINIDICSMKKISRSKIAVEMRTASAANSLVENAALANYDLIIYIPTHKVLKSSIIKGIPVFISEQELKTELKSISKIFEIRRLNRRSVRNSQIEHLFSTIVNVKFAG